MTKEIQLTLGKFTLVDDDDFEWLSKFHWQYLQSGGGYAVRSVRIKSKTIKIFMHRAIMLPRSDREIDHINHNGLDNRKSNLRECTSSQNHGNSRIKISDISGFRGVRFYPAKSSKPWQAQIKTNRKSKSLGYYKTAGEAAHAYDTAAIEFFGEFASLNFPEEARKL